MKKRSVQLGVALLALAAMTGCARKTAVPTVYPSTTTPGYTTTPNYTSTPNYNNNPYNTPNPYNTSPYGNNYYNNGSGYTPGFGSVPNMAMGRLTATVQKIQNGTFLGIGKFTVSVLISNPSQMALSGNLQVNFTDGGKSVKTVTDRVQVGPGQSVTRTYEDPSWKIDSATVNITTDNTDPMMSGMMNNGFGQTNPYSYPY